MKWSWIPLLLLASCTGEDWSDPVSVAAATTDVQIIEAIVNQQSEAWTKRTGRVSTLLVLNQVGSDSEVVGYLDRAKADGYGWGQPETWDAFFDASGRPLRIPPGVNACFQLITEQMVDMAFGSSGGYWDGNAAGFPASGGYFSFDALTLSEDGTEAIVLGSYICGGLCGSGSVYHVVLEAGVWRVAHAEWLWVS